MLPAKRRRRDSPDVRFVYLLITSTSNCGCLYHLYTLNSQFLSLRYILPEIAWMDSDYTLLVVRMGKSQNSEVLMKNLLLLFISNNHDSITHLRRRLDDNAFQKNLDQS